MRAPEVILERSLLVHRCMSVHVIGRVLGESDGSNERDDGVREAVGTVLVSEPRIGRALLEATRVTCKERGAALSAAACLGCDRLVNYRPSPDRKRVTIRCRWSADDHVHSLMRKAGSQVVVPRDSTLGEATALAQEYQQRHLLVVDDGMLVGMVDLAQVDITQRSARITDVMTRRMWITFPHASLSDARRIMMDSGCEALPVIRGTSLCGVLLWDDLAEVGLA